MQAYSDPARESDPHALPDSDPVGPFATEADALADAREGVEP